MRESPRDSRTLLKIRDEWVARLDVEEKEPLLFEFEMLIRAIERFFNLNNHPLWVSGEASVKNFSTEIAIVKMGIERIFAITQKFLGDNSNVFYFQKYIENKISRDSARDKLTLESMEQPDPKSSLFFLMLNLVSIHEVIKSVVERGHCNYSLFYNIGHIITRLVSMNRFFDPIKLPTFSPLFDRITNPKILKIVRKLKNENERKVVSVLFLAFFRFLKYLKFVNAEEKDEAKLKFNLLIFSLLKSECREISTYIEKEAPEMLKKVKGGEGLIAFLKDVKFQLDIEQRKVYEGVLKDFVAISNIGMLRATVDTARGVLNNNFQQIIVNLAKYLSPDTEGKEIFVDFVSRLEQSLRLREDLWIYRELLTYAEMCLNAGEGDEHYRPPSSVVNMLRDYVIYFQNLSFTLLRYSDLEPFEEFARFIFRISEEIFEKKEISHKTVKELKERVHAFRIFVEATLSHVNNRAELREVPFHVESAKELLEQFII